MNEPNEPYLLIVILISWIFCAFIGSYMAYYFANKSNAMKIDLSQIEKIKITCPNCKHQGSIDLEQRND